MFFFIFDDLCAFAMLLLMFVPSLVENGCKTKSVLQIENSGSTTTLIPEKSEARVLKKKSVFSQSTFFSREILSLIDKI